ncbi:MAG TPA: hypothetical protein PKA26_11110 [bacterium]|nr:hypothetical protein [bacterium]
MTSMVACALYAQDKESWIQKTSGEALYLEPRTGQWIPISAKQTIPLRTYLITHHGSKTTLYDQAEMLVLPDGAYFFVEDAIPKDRDALVGALTQIEAEHLPNRLESRPVSVGLTYGAPEHKNEEQIPYLAERINAVNRFYELGRKDASLLSLKRLLSKYPRLYRDKKNVEQLFSLYENLELYGYLYDESSRLLNLSQDAEWSVFINGWYKTARTYVTQQH